MAVLATTLHATEVMDIVKSCIDEKALTPTKTCVSIAREKSELEPTLTLKANIFYLCATACEKPDLYHSNKDD